MLQKATDVKVMYIQDMTILDLDADAPLAIESWDQAEQLLQGLQNNETLIRWMTGKLASQLPTDDEHHNFESWCRRARVSPGRVDVWRRMWELYDFDNEVKRFPELPHNHWEKLMGRMSKIKKLIRTGTESQQATGYVQYDKLLSHIEEANDKGLSCNQMMAAVKQAEGKSVPVTESPLYVQGQLAVLQVRVPGSVPADMRTCLVLFPRNEAEGRSWQTWADEHEVTDEVVKASFARVTTE